jgi:L-xylulose reductase
MQASRFGTRASIPYNLSKAAVDMLTKSMALELGPHNIRVNSVNPNIVMTNLARQWMAAGEGAVLKEKLIGRTPLGRITEVHEVVNTILFLLSDVAPMIHGEHVFIDGGFCAF